MLHVIQTRGTDGKGVRAIARDCERLKAEVNTPHLPAEVVRGSTVKWSDSDEGNHKYGTLSSSQ